MNRKFTVLTRCPYRNSWQYERELEMFIDFCPLPNVVVELTKRKEYYSFTAAWDGGPVQRYDTAMQTCMYSPVDGEMVEMDYGWEEETKTLVVGGPYGPDAGEQS